MKTALALCVAINLLCGWLPSETNQVDLLSMLNFSVASFAALVLGSKI